MKKPEELSEGDLRQIVEFAQQWLFLESGHDEDVWNLNKEVDCTEFVSVMIDILGDFDLAPDPSEEDGVSCLRCGETFASLNEDCFCKACDIAAEFDEWSGGFKPQETTFEERDGFLEGRELDAKQSRAMWPAGKVGGVIPPAFNLGLFRTHSKPIKASVAGVEMTLEPTEKDLGGNLGFRRRAPAQVVVGGCLVDAVVTVTVTITGTKGLR